MTDAPPYSPRLQHAITLSQAAAFRLGQPQVGPEQLLLGLLGLGEGSALRMLAAVGITADALEAQLITDGYGEHFHSDGAEERPLSADAMNALHIAVREANIWSADKVETMHLLLALLRDDSTRIARLVSSYGVEYQLLFDMAAYDRVGLQYN